MIEAAVGYRVLGAGLDRLRDCRGVDFTAQRDQCQVATAFPNQMLGVVERETGQIQRKQHQVEGLAGQHFNHVIGVLGKLGAHVQARGAQRAGDLFRLV